MKEVDRAGLHEGPVLHPADLPQAIRSAPRRHVRRQQSDVAPLEEIERQYIEFVVEKMDGHRVRAAEALGISERSLYRRLAQYGIE